jgi:hypothetical protein
MRPCRKIRVVEPGGREYFVSQEQAHKYIQSGDVRHIGPSTIYLKNGITFDVRGPMCAVSGATRGRGADGRPKLSTVEKLALGIRIRAQATVTVNGERVWREGETIEDYRVNLQELERIDHRILRSVLANPGPATIPEGKEL